MKLSDKLKEAIPNLNNNDFEVFKKTVDELLALASNDKEKDLIAEFIGDTINADTEQLILEAKTLCMKVQLEELNDIVPYSYIAKHYFNKSKSWLSQRVNGYDVNRKKAKFTNEELNTFELALHDISKKLGSITI
ncbi:DUF5053 domain-containing protein [Dysgonomonas sp. 520]|uniref:DUF5053 domain-containing protein n=1 Tax=Dysgonomonas sp. 520 TaxID=2302931 RepID=UPI0013D0EDDC|nr:DUF5053 domain-containing protein [Dysgonomonas sp. 520]NDW09831.1 DUF5053 domain-containing protein [Dysgonomonas sp. 520]